jgi:uncharacterized tellurite resistance protein B-like protein
MLRPYPKDSPSAAARIVALTMLADGGVSQPELDVLREHAGLDQLGLPPEQLPALVAALREDLGLHKVPTPAGDSAVDAISVAQALAEIESTALRETILRMCLRVAGADRRISDGETQVLTQAVEHWGLQRFMFAQRSAH